MGLVIIVKAKPLVLTKGLALELFEGQMTLIFQLTLWAGEPLMSTLSANLTREGLDLSLAFLAADRRADFRVDDWNW